MDTSETIKWLDDQIAECTTKSECYAESDDPIILMKGILNIGYSVASYKLKAHLEAQQEADASQEAEIDLLREVIHKCVGLTQMMQGMGWTIDECYAVLDRCDPDNREG